MARLDSGRLTFGEVDRPAHWEHPNLWSWRELLDGAAPDSTFVAFFLADPEDEPVDAHDAAFRDRIAG